MPNSKAQSNGSGSEVIKASEDSATPKLTLSPNDLFTLIGQKEAEIAALKVELARRDLTIASLSERED